jgi:uncharacterized integral membrane protein (TIGR00698 family)
MSHRQLDVERLLPRMRMQLTLLPEKARGLGIACTVGFAASFLSEHYSAPAMLFALLLGMALSFLSEDERSVQGIEFSASVVLRIGIALLGFRIAFSDVLDLGWQVLGLVVGGVVLTILFGLVAARSVGVNARMGVLTGGAVAICGASAAMAIAAALPQSPDKERNTAFVVVGVTALSTLAMIVYPILASFFGLSDYAAGVFLGGTIHDVAQVVGAGYSVSPTAGDVATLTKLLRVSMLLPVVMVLSLVFRTGHDGDSKRPPILPGFLVAFILCTLLNNLVQLPASLLEPINALSRYSLVAAIAAIGLKTDLRSLAHIGLKPVLLLLAETLWLVGLMLIGLRVLGQ